MEIWEDRQKNPVADEVSALVAVTGPIIAGVLRSVSGEVTSAFGDRGQLPLKMLGRLREEGDGDCGIAFEYAMHNAVVSREPPVAERVADALSKCGVSGSDPASILFAIEKSGAQELISTEPGLVMENSPVLLSEGRRPVGLREHLAAIGAAFRLPGALLNLAQSIRGLWKSELFLGSADDDQWVSAGVHMNPSPLRPAKALHIAIIPNMPGPSDIPGPLHREVARIFVERREFPIGDVLDATRMFAQPGLLTSSTGVVSNVPFGTTAPPATSVMITPIARTSGRPGMAHDALALPLTEQRAPW